MRRTSAWVVAAGVLAAVAGCSSGPATAKGCTPPPHEDALLAAYLNSHGSQHPGTGFLTRTQAGALSRG